MNGSLFGTVLIANRGEIALRVIRACRELGIRSVAVYSTADRDSAAVAAADHAVHIGPAPSRRSYLSIPAIIEAAHQSGADAIHPGYGFLSEDPDFAEVCAEEKLTFIGPRPHTMAQLGDKSVARGLMSQAGLPLLPGSIQPLADGESAAALARQIGYPVIIKAVAGGGGRGMTVVHDPADFAAAFSRTQATALAVFGDPRVYVECYVVGARHVEIQVLCDSQGNGIHLGARDCSVQRRHQKLIEESPSAAVSAEVAEEMGQAAVRAVLAVGYEGAGTVEFVVDAHGRYSFMEVNCRIQVEHPVTELMTGVDLVQEQLRIASGLPLRYTQDDIRPSGHAIECRVNCEDPRRDFIPTPGVLDRFDVPGGPFVRVDTHGRVNYRIPSDYDSLLAKVIVWAPDRDAAIDRMLRALAEFKIEGRGVRSTIDFVCHVLDSEQFRAASHDTALVAELLAGFTA